MRTLITSIFAAVLVFSSSAQAMSKTELNAKADAAVKVFYADVPAGKELARKSKAMLVFPSVLKAGLGIGGEYGEGVLYQGGKKVAYYSTAAASIGFQAGGQVKTQILLFMTDEALKNFRNSKGWKAGVDGSVAIATIGAGGALDTNTVNAPVIGFVFSNKGLMYNATIEGSKITEIKKK